MSTDTGIQTVSNHEIVMVKMPSALDLAIKKKYPGKIKRDSWVSLMKTVKNVR